MRVLSTPTQMQHSSDITAATPLSSQLVVPSSLSWGEQSHMIDLLLSHPGQLISLYPHVNSSLSMCTQALDIPALLAHHLTSGIIVVISSSKALLPVLASELQKRTPLPIHTTLHRDLDKDSSSAKTLLDTNTFPTRIVLVSARDVLRTLALDRTLLSHSTSPCRVVVLDASLPLPVMQSLIKALSLCDVSGILFQSTSSSAESNLEASLNTRQITWQLDDSPFSKPVEIITDVPFDSTNGYSSFSARLFRKLRQVSQPFTTAATSTKGAGVIVIHPRVSCCDDLPATLAGRRVCRNVNELLANPKDSLLLISVKACAIGGFIQSSESIKQSIGLIIHIGPSIVPLGDLLEAEQLHLIQEIDWEMHPSDMLSMAALSPSNTNVKDLYARGYFEAFEKQKEMTTTTIAQQPALMKTATLTPLGWASLGIQPGPVGALLARAAALFVLPAALPWAAAVLAKIKPETDVIASAQQWAKARTKASRYGWWSLLWDDFSKPLAKAEWHRITLTTGLSMEQCQRMQRVMKELTSKYQQDLEPTDLSRQDEFFLLDICLSNLYPEDDGSLWVPHLLTRQVASLVHLPSLSSVSTLGTSATATAVTQQPYRCRGWLFPTEPHGWRKSVSLNLRSALLPTEVARRSVPLVSASHTKGVTRTIVTFVEESLRRLEQSRQTLAVRSSENDPTREITSTTTRVLCSSHLWDVVQSTRQWMDAALVEWLTGTTPAATTAEQPSTSFASCRRVAQQCCLLLSQSEYFARNWYRQRSQFPQLTSRFDESSGHLRAEYQNNAKPAQTLLEQQRELQRTHPESFDFDSSLTPSERLWLHYCVCAVSMCGTRDVETALHRGSPQTLAFLHHGQNNTNGHFRFYTDALRKQAPTLTLLGDDLVALRVFLEEIEESLRHDWKRSRQQMEMDATIDSITEQKAHTAHNPSVNQSESLAKQLTKGVEGEEGEEQNVEDVATLLHHAAHTAQTTTTVDHPLSLPPPPPLSTTVATTSDAPSILVHPLPQRLLDSATWLSREAGLTLSSALSERLRFPVGPGLVVGFVGKIELPNEAVQCRAIEEVSWFWCLGTHVDIYANNDRI